MVSVFIAMITEQSSGYMSLAIEQAKLARGFNEVPVGAVVVSNNIIIGSGFNSVIKDHSVSSHAEIIAINAASKKLNNHRLPDCDLYVTLEPCHMCAKAIVDARINNVYFATKEPKNGSIVSRDHFFEKEHLNHRVSYFSGLMQEEASELLKSFFQTLRD
jgi:tRNA(adenine34) deaminase|tara:strand:+ start:2891 stop:3370 length:480 start_codon:yes stop_codon:yes gene_type:complete